MSSSASWVRSPFFPRDSGRRHGLLSPSGDRHRHGWSMQPQDSLSLPPLVPASSAASPEQSPDAGQLLTSWAQLSQRGPEELNWGGAQRIAGVDTDGEDPSPCGVRDAWWQKRPSLWHHLVELGEGAGNSFFIKLPLGLSVGNGYVVFWSLSDRRQGKIPRNTDFWSRLFSWVETRRSRKWERGCCTLLLDQCGQGASEKQGRHLGSPCPLLT